MTRRVVLVLLTAWLLALVFPAAGAVGQSDPASTTTSAPATSEGGTSPWVLVLIGVAMGVVVGVPTGLVRRRRAERQQGGPKSAT